METMHEGLIDLWNVETFDDGLLAEMRCEAKMLRAYFTAEHANHEAYVAPGNWSPFRENPHGHIYNLFLENVLTPMMRSRRVRGWHYTRMTDFEVERLRAGGVYPSNLEAIRSRLDGLVAAGVVSSEMAIPLFASSSFHTDEYGSRDGKFWVVSQPVSVDQSDVTDLLRSWGGESIYFHLSDAHLKTVVEGIGRPRVLEIALPIDAGPNAYSTACAVLKTYAHSIACEVLKDRLDLHATRALGPEAVLAVHTKGDVTYGRIGRGYPPLFVDDRD